MTPTLVTVLGTILVATITVTGGIVGAAVSFYLTKRHEQRAQWQQDKLNHYRVLLSALSDWLGAGIDKDDAKKRFVLAVNTIALVAPQDVIDACMDYTDQLAGERREAEQLNRLLLAVRRDIGLSGTDNPNTFRFRLVTARNSSTSDNQKPS
jgi:hypothetical protein